MRLLNIFIKFLQIACVLQYIGYSNLRIGMDRNLNINNMIKTIRINIEIVLRELKDVFIFNFFIEYKFKSYKQTVMGN